ncbi:MAG TPA: phosphotransferase [Ktedonobacterales bacterium]|nr:phosphotransferase [Ktedonobacterales bacterium]
MTLDDDALAAAALDTLRENWPDETVERVEVITRGWDSLALLVNGHWLLRVARRPEVGASLSREARLLPVIAAAVAPVRVPVFTITRLEGPGPAVVGYEAIQGAPLAPESLAGTEAGAAAIAREVARFLTALHSAPIKQAVGVGLTPASAEAWRAEYAALRAWSRAHAAPLLPPDTRARLERLWAGYLDEPGNFRFQPVLIHRDLGIEHVLLEADGRLAGVIDWGDAAIGDPAIDFAGFLGGLGEPFTRWVIARWAGPCAAGETEETLLARAAFYVRLAPLHAIQYGLLVGSDAHVRQGVAGLARE